MQKEYQYYSIIGGCVFVFSLLVYAYAAEFFVLYIPSHGNYLSLDEKISKITKKKINLHYWDGHTIQHEQEELMWSSDPITNINHVISQLLQLFVDEKVMSDKITLQSALLSPSGQDLYLSFSKPFFDQERSIHQKLMVIESILLTLKETITSDRHVHFLVNHHPIQDAHLDFSHSWPL